MARKTPPRLLAVALLTALAGLFLAACGGDDGGEPPSSSSRACPGTLDPPPKWADLRPPKRSVRRTQSLVAAVDTSRGSFEIALDARNQPKTVSSFAYLARQGFYDGTTFHRIVPNFLIQAGDPLGTSLGGPGYCIDEPPPDDTEYTRGTVAMGKTESQPLGRSGSQFFVVTAADAGLPPVYAVLGEVSSGEDVVAQISKLGDPAGSGEPTARVVIRTITISEG
jgi:cyclophilin family peptidyl-prolyl cis-trans isomerase